MTPSEPFLSREARTQLKSLLAERADALPWAAAQGFVTAIAALPSPPPPSTWMARVLGRKEAASPQAVQTAVALLMRLLGEEAAALEAAAGHRPPRDLKGPDLESWAAGFVEAVELDGSAGAPLLGEVPTRIALAARAAASEEGARDALASAVDGLYASWAEARAEEAARLDEREGSTPAQSTRIDRNGPCPCGSGKKAKRCCGTGRVAA